MSLIAQPSPLPSESRFSHQCTENLTPENLANLEQSAHWAGVATDVGIGAQIVGVVELTALIVAGLAIAILNPHLSIPGVVFAALVGGMVLSSAGCGVTVLSIEHSKSMEKKIRMFNKVKSHFGDLRLQNQGTSNEKLAALAFAKYWENKSATVLQERDVHFRQGDAYKRAAEIRQNARLDQFNYLAYENEYEAAYFCEFKALKAKLKAAFAKAASEDIERAKLLHQLGIVQTINPRPFWLGALNRLENFRLENFEMLTFHDRNLAPITYGDLKNSSIEQIAGRFRAAMR